MTQPEKVLIPHDDYHFESVGHFPDGRQFMAFISGAFPGEPYHWRGAKRWIAVIHIFDSDGNHLTTEACLIGFNHEEPLPWAKMYAKMSKMLADLLSDYKIDDNYFCDIWIRPFRTVIDDIYYEFVYKRQEKGDKIYEQMALWPNDVVFYPPWNDGRYDT